MPMTTHARSATRNGTTSSQAGEATPQGLGMEITSVDVTPFVDKKLRAFATILLDGCFIVRGLKIIEGQGGLFVAMPNKRRQDGSYQDIAHPITSEFRRYMEDVVIAAYKQRDPEPNGGPESP